MMKYFAKIVLLPVLLACLTLLSCKSTSSLLQNHDAPELNQRAPQAFDACLETTRGTILIEVRRDRSA